MAGEIPLPKGNYPDDFQLKVFGPFTSASADQVLQFITDRDMVVDSVFFSARVAGSTDATFRLLLRDNTADTTVASTVSAAREICTAQSLDSAVYTANTTTTARPSSSYNLVKAGNQIVLDFEGTLTNLADLFIAIRFRSRRR